MNDLCDLLLPPVSQRCRRQNVICHTLSPLFFALLLALISYSNANVNSNPTCINTGRKANVQHGCAKIFQLDIFIDILDYSVCV